MRKWFAIFFFILVVVWFLRTSLYLKKQLIVLEPKFEAKCCDFGFSIAKSSFEIERKRKRNGKQKQSNCGIRIQIAKCGSNKWLVKNL